MSGSGPSALETWSWRTAIVGIKVLTLGFAADALLHGDSPRLRGKAIRARAFGYTAALGIVPLSWAVLGRRGSAYPRALDLARSLPMFLDAAGNGLGLYEEAHIDDLVHFANAAITSGLVGTLAAPRLRTRWEAGLAGAFVAISAEAVWEVLEYGAMRLGAGGMSLTYEDTIVDIATSTLGAIAGGVYAAIHVGRPSNVAGAAPTARRATAPGASSAAPVVAG